MDALEDPRRRDATLRTARLIARKEPRPAVLEIFQCLVEAAASPRRHPAAARDDVVRDQLGTPMFRIRRLRSAIALLVPSDKMSAPVLAAVTQQLLELLGHSNGAPDIEKHARAQIVRSCAKAELLEPMAT